MATAIRSEARSSVLFAPQDYLSARTLTTIAVAQALVGLFLSRYGIRYDGVVDVHRTWLGDATPLWLAVLDQIASLVVAAMGAALALRAWGQRLPLRSVVHLVAIARVPLVLISPLVLLIPTPASVTHTGLNPAAANDLVFSSLGAVIGVAWMVAIVATGIRSHVPQRGGKLAAVVLSALLCAEVASKLILAAAG